MMKFNPFFLILTILVISILNPIDSLGQKKIKQDKAVVQQLYDHDHKKCGIDAATERLGQNNPDYLREVEEFKNHIIPAFAETPQSMLAAAPIIYIPVVVHVIHNGEAVGTGANLAEDRILAQIDYLNLDFSATNPNYNDTPAQWQDDVGNPEVQFCMAIIDPDGNPTNGITRHNIAVTGTNANNSNIEDEIKPATWWDSDEYYNIYVVSIPGTTAGGGTTGYAYYPTNSMIGSDLDGSVVDYNWFGGPGFGQSGYGTLTHETGHYLGLPHPFDGEDCGADDNIGDTPNVDAPTSDYNPGLNCSPGNFPTGPMSCTNEHMYVNYMDYVNDDDCSTSFSNGQISVMRAVLEGNPAPAPFNYGSRLPLANNATTVCSFFEDDAGISAIVNPTSSICGDGPITPVVTLQNFGENNLTTVTISYQVNGGTAVDFIWVDNLGTGATQDVTLAPYTPPAGDYTFTVYTNLPNGVVDGQTSNDQMEVTVNTVIPGNIPLFEGFEDAQWDPTVNGVFQFNVTGDIFEWERSTAVSANGVGAASAVFNNYSSSGGSNPNNTTDGLLTSVYDFSGVSGASLTFDVAYAPYDNQFFDSLKVYASIDCGSSFTELLFADGNLGLATAPATTGLFTPTSSEWENHTIDLSAYDNSPNLTIAFINESGYGNQLFLDNINISAGCSMTLQPSETNPNCSAQCDGIAAVTIADGIAPYTYLWDANANNATSETVQNLCEGNYSVTVTDAANCTAEIMVTLTDPSILTLAVSNTNETDVNANDGTATATAVGGTGVLTYLWSNTESTPMIDNLEPGTYSVIVTDENNCAVTEIVVIAPANPWANDAGIFLVADPVGDNCASEVTPFVELFNYGSLPLDSVVISYQVDGGTMVDSVWVGPLAPEGSIMISLESYIPPTGTYDFEVSTSLPNGVQDEDTANDLKLESITTLEKVNLPYIEDFENSTTYPTINETNQIDSDGDMIEWYLVDGVSGFGIGNQSTRIDNDTVLTGGGTIEGTMDAIATPILDFSEIQGASLTFDVAYAVHTDGSVDSLRVVASTDCGDNFDQVLFFDGNVGLATAPPASNSFIPSPDQWETHTIDLSAFDNADNFSIRFYNLSGSGNAIYIDNINVTPACVMSLQMNAQNISCNGFCEGIVSVEVSNGIAPFTYLWGANAGNSTDSMVQNLCAGVYFVTVTDNIGCSTIEEVELTEPSALNLSVSSTDQTYVGLDDGTATADLSGGSPPYTYLWNDSNSQTTQIATGLGPGTYCVTVTDGNDCSEESCISIDEIDCTGFTVNATGEDVTCFGLQNGTANATAENGTEPYTYLWNTADETNVVTGLGEGTYTVTATDAVGCTGEMSVDIEEPNFLGVSVVCTDETVAGANDGSCTATASGGTLPYSETWSPNVGSGTTITNLSPGTYCVTITDDNGCTEESCGTVNAVNCNLSVELDTENVSCFELEDGTAGITISGGTTPFTIAWGTGQSTANIDGLAAGSYSVTVTDNQSCESIEQFVITEPDELTISFNASNPTTNGANDGSATAMPSGGTPGYEYAWDNGGTAQSIFNLTAGVYVVTVTDLNSCTYVNEVQLEDPAVDCSSLTGEMTTFDALCGFNDGAAQVLVNGGTEPYEYLWSNNGETTTGINGINSGIYTVTVTDANDCEMVLTGEVLAPEPLTVSLGATPPSAPGASDGVVSATPVGGTPNYSYVWNTSPPQTTQTVVLLPSGTYSVTITDDNGCTAENVVILEDPNIDCSSFEGDVTIENITCASTGSAQVLLSGGSMPYEYLWSNTETTAEVFGLTAGVYTVTVSDADNCELVMTVEMTNPPTLEVSQSSTNPTSAGANDGTAMVLASGGLAPYTYLWNTAEVTSSISGLSAGTYEVTVTDENACTEVLTFTLIDPSGSCNDFEVDFASIIDITCNGFENGALVAMAANGELPYSYSWSNGVMTAVNAGLGAGPYTVTATDNMGCTAEATIEMVEPPLLEVTITSTPASSGTAMDGTATANPVGGVPGYTYEWSNSEATQSIVGLAPGVYTVTITDENDCVVAEEVTIGIDGVDCSSFSIIDFEVMDVNCFGGFDGSATAIPSGGTMPITYEWSNLGDEQSISGLQAGVYVVTATDANGCETVNEVEVSQPDAGLNIDFNTTPESSPGSNDGAIDVTVSGGTPTYSYLWSNSEVTEDLSNLSAGTYDLEVTDANDCTVSISIIVPGNGVDCSTFELDAQFENVSCAGAQDGLIVTTATGGINPISYNWSSGEMTQSIFSLNGGVYTVTVVDGNNCEIVQTFEITEATPVILTVASSDETMVGANDGTANAGAVGGVPGYTYLWSNGAMTASIDNLSPGNYTVTVTDSNGCTAVESVTIEAFTDLCTTFDASLESTSVDCSGNENGSATALPTGGLPPYSYNWNNGSMSANNNNISGGTYTVTISDANDCVLILSVDVEEPQDLELTVEGVGGNCGTGGTAFVTVVGGTQSYNYIWSNGGTNNSISDLANGVYSVTITDANGCTIDGETEIENTAGGIGIDYEVDAVTCFGDSDGEIDITVTQGVPPYTFEWSNDETTEDIEDLEEGTYSVLITDANNCTFLTTFVVPSPAELASTISWTPAGMDNSGTATANVFGGTTPYIYSWSNGSNDPFLEDLSPGNYSLTVTDANGCMVEDNIVISLTAVNELPDLESLSISPNPSNGQFVLDAVFSTFKEGNVEVYNVVGQKVYQHYFSTQDLSLNIGLLNQAAGSYFLVVSTTEGRAVRKLIITK